MDILTPEQRATIEDAAEAFKRVAELLKEFADRIADTFEEIMENIEIHERETFEPCRKIGFPRAPQISAKLWRKNRALFRPYKRGI